MPQCRAENPPLAKLTGPDHNRIVNPIADILTPTSERSGGGEEFHVVVEFFPNRRPVF